MKFRTWLFVAISALIVSPAGFAQSPKIGYVDAVALVDRAPQGEASLRQLESEFGPRDRELRQMRDELKAMEQDLEKNSLVMSNADLQAKQREITTLNRRLKRSQQEFKEDYSLRRNEELAKLQRLVTEAIVEIAKEEGYDLIVQQAVYASETINITDDVLNKLAQ